MLQNERYLIVGRLFATLAHEINNSMQAIQGALTLASEDVYDPQALIEYINISQKEADRVIASVKRIRQIYHPQIEKENIININDIIKDALLMTRKEMERLKVRAQTDLASTIGNTTGNLDQIFFAFLSIILSFTDMVYSSGGNNFLIRADNRGDMVLVEIIYYWGDLEEKNIKQADQVIDIYPPEHVSSLTLAREIIETNGGNLRVNRNGNNDKCLVSFQKIRAKT